MKNVTEISFFVALFCVLIFSKIGHAEGIFGGAIKEIGRATGIKPIEDLGRNADSENRRVKEHNPLYRSVEEDTSEFVRRQFTQACTAPYQTITNGVIAICSNWNGRLEDQHLIENAQRTLVDQGVFQFSDFNDIQVRWCPLNGAHGMAPDSGMIYLDLKHKQASQEQLAALLVHEMIHIMQYRRMGTDNFKCEYSRNYVDCGSCQDNGHPLEREAYAFENNVAVRLSNSKYSQHEYAQPNYVPSNMHMNTGIAVRYCQTPMGTCSIPPAMAPMGTSCFCNAPNGRQISGSAF